MLKLDEAKQDSNKMTKYPKMLKLDQAKQDPARMTNEEPHQLPEESSPRCFEDGRGQIGLCQDNPRPPSCRKSPRSLSDLSRRRPRTGASPTSWSRNPQSCGTSRGG